ncbi:UDP-N-acetylmuramate--L-alanine ligase [Haliovirga abyssi]|uniref:UDP-N-acetylmuramate--L-alanine ligase n=1 Tax=Haliovirga abyssi TaxID=2996794 RepID=A0AAU9DRM2_9FUSO|nr:UDP-N-acetylmuramate--L-alanine ligase [Haliovirga abyssi]BDU49599.1 UDP-N-acetylmuramate--L-alanine ligase [Haliovirga abyssi]
MKKVFFIGISGIGMSGLAKIMLKKGYEVYGSDISEKDVTSELVKLGAVIYKKHIDLNAKKMDLVVYSTAIKKSNPEYIFAKLNGIKLLKRGELLAELFNEKKGIAVAGTHGKTTTSSMLGVSLFDINPTIIVGGIIPEIGSNSKFGKSEYMVVEADESDNSFLYLNPEYSIITNIEADHLEKHGTFENIKKSFLKFMEKTKKEVIVCKDCEVLDELAKQISERDEEKKIITYSLKDKTANIYCENIYIKNGITHYTVIENGEEIGEFELKIPGEHNILNSLGVIYIARKLKIEKEKLKNKLKNFKGAKRRFDILYENSVRIIDDYAHHPTEIKATLTAAREIYKDRIIAIFQPHRYSRTKFLMDSFEGAFGNADKVILLPIYSAGEKNIYDINENILADKINNNVKIIRNREEITKTILDDKVKGDTYIFMGAGDIYKLAYEMKEILER